MDGSADLAFLDFIARVRSLSDMPAELAEEVAPELQQIAVQGATSGVDPTTGQAWAPRKVDGQKAYPHPGNYITTEAIGTVVQMRVRYPYSFGQTSHGKTMPARRMIPSAGDSIPRIYLQAFERAAAKVFARKMEGR